MVTPFLPGRFAAVRGRRARGGRRHVRPRPVRAARDRPRSSGDNTNYWIGRYVGPRVFSRQKLAALQSRAPAPHASASTTSTARRRYSSRASCPIVRTFAPFVAGIGRMRYPTFLFYSFAGSIAWVGSLTYAGYLLRQRAGDQAEPHAGDPRHRAAVDFAGIVEYVRHRYAKAKRR